VSGQLVALVRVRVRVRVRIRVRIRGSAARSNHLVIAMLYSLWLLTMAAYYHYGYTIYLSIYLSGYTHYLPRRTLEPDLRLG
jgi:hypothetical protein